MTNNQDGIEALLRGIDYLLEQKIKKLDFDKTATGIITKVNSENTYDILMDNKIYKQIPSMVRNLKTYDTIKILIPQNNYSGMYITGKIQGEELVENVDGSTNSTAHTSV